MSELSILQVPQGQLFDALKKSQLKDLVKPDNLSRIAQAAAHLLNNEKLRACDEMSILGALQKAVSLGFRLEPEFGECYLIPRSLKVKVDGKEEKKMVCVFQIGYKGWKAMALQSGNVAWIDGEAVYDDDKFAYKYGTSAFLDHEPANIRKGKMTHFYAFCMLQNGMPLFKVITGQDSEKSRTHSEEQYDWHGSTKVFSPTPKGIWAKHYAAMALRVPIRKVCAALPLTKVMEDALQADGGAHYLQKDGTVTTITESDVEKQGEQPDEYEWIPDELDAAFFDWKNTLAQCNTFSEVFANWSKQDNMSGLMEFHPFVMMFYKEAARTAETKADIVAFMDKVPEKWRKDLPLKKILTDRLKQIENGKA